MARQSFVGPWPLFQFLDFYLHGRTPWAGDQPVARPLPRHRTAQTQKTHTDIRASIGIRRYDPSVQAGEDGSCLILRGHYVGNFNTLDIINLINFILKSHRFGSWCYFGINAK
jgi:hypothetical protein